MMMKKPAERVIGSFPDEACGFMALTRLGAAQMVGQGRRLRERYVKELGFLSEGFRAEEYFVRSTDVARTVMTAQAVLLGLQPDALREGALGLPILVRPAREEYMYPSYRLCPRYRAERERLRGPFAEIDGRLHGALREALGGCLGEHAGLERGWQSVANSLAPVAAEQATHLCEEMRRRHPRVYGSCAPAAAGEGSVLPACLTEGLLEGAQRAAGAELAHKFGTPLLARLAIGGFVDDLMSDLEDKLARPLQPRRLALYSGHDSTLAPLLAAFRVFDDCLPPLGSVLVLELHQHPRSRQGYVRLIYNDRVLPLPQAVAPAAPDGAADEPPPPPLPGAVSWEAFSALSAPVR
ncbi:MAG: histidine phosphatase family protein, partial [archaeon]|nr:histidine phosphatase family protein [archaeon]